MADVSPVFLAHVKLGKEIDRLVGERFFLSKEFKAKKCNYMCTRCLNRQLAPEECKNHVHAKYQPRSQEDDEFFTTMVYVKRDTLTMGPFPSGFRCYLEEVMLLRDPSIGSEYFGAYYGPREEPSDEALAHAMLSDAPTLTTQDRAVIANYVERLLAFMQKAVELASNTKKEWVSYMKKELDRTIKVVRDLIPEA